MVLRCLNISSFREDALGESDFLERFSEKYSKRNKFGVYFSTFLLACEMD